MPQPQAPLVDAAFARKVRFSRMTLYFERLWPRLWLILGVAGLFLFVSLLNVWVHLPRPAHIALLGGFGLALLAAIISAARVNYPSRDEAVRRLENASGIPHRPASSYEDTVTANAEDPRTSAIWQAHRARLAAALARLRVGPPHPRADRADPVALRALLMLGVVAAASLVGDSGADRLRSAFRFNSLAALASARLDAWVTPPSYTTRPPVMLADGARGGAVSPENAKLVEVPERSVLIVRATGSGLGALSLEVLNEGATEKQNIAAKAPDAGKTSGSAAEISEVRYELRKSAEVRVLAGGSELARWPFYVIPDKAPKIALTKDPERTRRGALKLDYTVEDDYGVVSAEAKVTKAETQQKPADPSKDWARPEPLKGPRLPLEHLPTLTLRLPRGNTHAAQTYLDVAPHPYAGREVMLTLEARDVAGNVGRSKPVRIVLPQRRFEKPLARALVEQRGKLLEDSRYRPQVLRALDALTYEPEGFIDNASIYLSLRALVHGLEHDGSRTGLKSATDGLWEIALRVEDGDLSDAEKALRDAQDKLAEALEKGAPDNEIQALMQQLRDALSKYVEQLAKNSKDQNPPEGLDQENQQLSQQDLERMMKELEDTARTGSRDQAQQMLSQLRDLLERLQSGQMNKKDGERGQMLMKKLDDLGNMIGQQQRLMDQTYNEHRRAQRQLGGSTEGGRERQSNRGQPGQPGQNGEGSDEQQGQPGQQGQRGKNGQQQGQGLGAQQKALREELEKLRKSLDELGANSKELEGAGDSMKDAEQSLDKSDTGSALGDQSQALDQMRQGAQKMAEEAQKNGQSRFGQNGDTPRDPLGRPQRFQGPDPGNSVKVPDEIDMQRAREILEELRRRVAQPTRPPVELDYFERLLRRF